MGTRSAKYWKTEEIWSENSQAGKTEASRYSQSELEDVGRNGIKHGAHITRPQLANSSGRSTRYIVTKFEISSGYGLSDRTEGLS